MDCFPIPFVCFQCGTDQNPCHCKVVGPTLGINSRSITLDILLIRYRFCRCGVLCGMLQSPTQDFVTLRLMLIIGGMLASCAIVWMFVEPLHWLVLY